ncbi:murein biosynthesis integral membrane protein MurJ [Desulfogranum japonicum]|uniref:murein biosynthesis integral membrane protein MurJ n=1 Tax=Desulfogranum japonicum TaxID=231447 RepID=UPI000407A85B|nr:murein biosynthesis integral membrane protein MurJ [Desulfogranum japonicum]
MQQPQPTKPSSSTGKIARSAGSVGSAVMCSRVLGLVREQLFAALFGAGMSYDAFVVAFRIPNLLRDLFGEGALSAAFVTVFTEYDTNKGQKATWELASTVLIFFAIALSALVLIGIYWSEPIVHLLAHDFQNVDGKIALTAKLTRIMFPFLILISLSAVVMGILNTKGRFFIPALASSFFNLGSILGGVTLSLLFPKFGQPAITGMAVGTLIGGLLQLSIQLPTLYKTGFRFIPRIQPNHPGLKKILWLMLPATIGLSATQINIFINTNFAAGCEQGAVSWLNYAFRFVQLPIGLFGVAFSIAAMPVLARQAAEKQIDKLKTTFVSSLVMVFSLTIPATVGLLVLAEPIIRLVFEHGVFTGVDTLKTAQALQFYALGLFAYSSVKVMVPVFYAINTTKFPVIGSFIGVAANLLIIVMIIDHLQFRGIALATSCAMTCNFLFLALTLTQKLEGLPLGYLLRGILKIGIAAIIMGVTTWWGRSLLRGWLQGPLPMQAAGVFILIGSAAVLYALLLQLLKLPEFTMLTEKMVQRFARSKRSCT